MTLNQSPHKLFEFFDYMEEVQGLNHVLNLSKKPFQLMWYKNGRELSDAQIECYRKIWENK